MATNTLGNYNETFFAQEGLIQLEKALGMAGRVHRGYDPQPRAHGDTINIRRPSTFSALDAPSSAQNVTTESVSITLNQWKEVKFSLTDKELSLSSEKIISDHIRPAAYALADNIDQAVAALYKKVPWYTTLTSTPVLSDLTAARKVMFDNRVPMSDPAALHGMVDGSLEAALLNALAATGMQPRQQDPAVRAGAIGELFGINWFANQNTPSHTSGVSADATGAINNGAGYAAGTTTINFDGVTSAGTFAIGDSFSIAGDTQRYVMTNAVTASTGAVTGATIYPALKQAVADDAVITFYLGGSAKAQNLAFHRNAFALAMAPLTEIGNELGAKIATVSDPITNLAIRSRMFYDGDASAVFVALDVLYGVQILDPNLAVRLYAA